MHGIISFEAMIYAGHLEALDIRKNSLDLL